MAHFSLFSAFPFHKIGHKWTKITKWCLQNQGANPSNVCVAFWMVYLAFGMVYLVFGMVCLVFLEFGAWYFQWHIWYSGLCILCNMQIQIQNMNSWAFEYEVEGGEEEEEGGAHFLGHLMSRIRHDRALGILSLFMKIQIYLENTVLLWKMQVYLEKHRFTWKNAGLLGKVQLCNTVFLEE